MSSAKGRLLYSPSQYRGAFSSDEFDKILLHSGGDISPEIQNVLELFFVEGRTYTDIGEETERSRQAIYQRTKIFITTLIEKGAVGE